MEEGRKEGRKKGRKKGRKGEYVGSTSSKKGGIYMKEGRKGRQE
jgi:hypothetical protein